MFSLPRPHSFPALRTKVRMRATTNPHFFLQEGKRKKLALNDSECQYSPYQWLRTKNSLLTRLNVAPKSGRREIIPAHEKGAAEDRRQDHVATIFPFSASLRRFTSSEPGAGGEARPPRIVGVGSMRGAQPDR